MQRISQNNLYVSVSGLNFVFKNAFAHTIKLTKFKQNTYVVSFKTEAVFYTNFD